MNSPFEAGFDRWIVRFRGLARLGGGDATIPDVDEMGHLRPQDAAFLHWRRLQAGADAPTHRPLDPEPSPATGAQAAKIPAAPLDEIGLWRVLGGPAERDPGRWEPILALAARGQGPLFDQGNYRTIEAWTEADLCGLHALHRLGLRARSGEVLRACDRIAMWHLKNTQPDNATNRPWAVQVFASLSANTGSDEARMYAETLLHNTMVELGRPERVAAEILRDAAEALLEARDLAKG